MSTTGWVVLGVIVVDRDLGDQRLQRPRRHAAEDQPGLRRHRRAAQAAPRPDPQSGGDGKGLCRARERNAGGGGPGAQRGDRRARRRAEGGGGKHAHRRAAAIVRIVGKLSEPEGQRELPAVAVATCPTSRTSSPPRAASSTTRCRNTTPASSSSRRRCLPACSASRSATSSIVGDDRAQLEQAPSVKF